MTITKTKDSRGWLPSITFDENSEDVSEGDFEEDSEDATEADSEATSDVFSGGKMAQE